MGSLSDDALLAEPNPAKQTSVDDLLRFTAEQNASDLHLKPMRPPLIRVTGKLVPLEGPPLQPEQIHTLIDGMLTPRQRKLLDEDMSVDFGYSVPGVSRFRASVFQQRGTPSAVFRRVPFNFRSLDEWGLPEVLHELTDLPQGLVLITGPTGSGKSSTLASMMRRIVQTRLGHIVTIEDPIEFLLNDERGSVTQREVGTDTPSFEMALRNVLRQDPDVIMVGEMRDGRTIQTVLTAAETGHLVFSTLHTNSAVQTIDRILDTFPERSHRQICTQLGSVLQAVVSLKLIERSDGEGLVAAVEILRRTPRTSKLIQQGNLDGLEEEMENSVAYFKMQSMNQSLAALVLHRVVEHETAMAASSNPGDLDLILRRFLYKATDMSEIDSEGEMTEPLSDFSKILELQEIKRAYEELQERQSHEIGERDSELARLRARVGELEAGESAPSGAAGGANLKQENTRLARQLDMLRLEYEAKIERLNTRIRELSGASTSAPATEPERKGFFRR